MSEVNKYLYFGDFHPLHNGHIEVINQSLQIPSVDEIDLHVSGKRKKNIEIPLEIKQKFIRASLIELELDSNVNVLETPESLFDISTNDYKGVIVGSDIANKLAFSPRVSFFHGFDNIIISNREDDFITNETRAELKNIFKEIIFLEPHLTLSATKIREAVLENKDISQYVPNSVNQILQKISQN